MCTGGEEYIVLLLDSGRAATIELANRVIRSLFEQYIPHSSSPITDRVTVSAGAATSEINDKTTAELLITQADNALYTAKHKGRNQVSY